jgi:hypothetical protein
MTASLLVIDGFTFHSRLFRVLKSPELMHVDEVGMIRSHGLITLVIRNAAQLPTIRRFFASIYFFKQAFCRSCLNSDIIKNTNMLGAQCL